MQTLFAALRMTCSIREMPSGDEKITIKSGDLFFLCEPGGDVPLDHAHGLGLYYHDCRFLNGYTLTIEGEKPEPLESEAEQGRTASLRLCNPQLHVGGQTLLKGAFEIYWSRTVSSERLALFDTITLRSRTNRPIGFSLTLSLRAEFEDIFAVRGMSQARRGKLHLPSWKNDGLHFLYKAPIESTGK